MNLQELFQSQAYNNQWANHRLIGACKRLSTKALGQNRTGFFPNIIETLNHILIVDWFYVSALEGDCMGLTAFKSLVPFADINDLADAQRVSDARLVALCSGCDPSGQVQLVRGDSIEAEDFSRTFQHLIQHQIHHRGQVHAMLSGTDVAPPQLDEFYLQGDVDKARRAPDLAAMGLSETDIWG